MADQVASSPSRVRRVEIAAVIALAAFAFVNALAWAIVLPLGDAPDEPTHFVVVAFELVHRSIPEVGVDDWAAMATVGADGVRSPLYSYSAQPGLSYIVSAAAIHLLAGDSDEPARYARFPGALWSGLFVLVTYAGTRRMMPSAPGVPLLASTVAAFWPQLTFVFSYVNNDGLTALASAALVASWWAGFRNGWRNRDAALTGVLAGLAFLNKPNGFPIAVAAGLVMVTTLSGEWGSRLRRLALAGGACLATSGWWYWIAYGRYGWDLFGEARADAVRESLGLVWRSGRFYGRSLFETAFEPFPRFGETWFAGTMRTAVGAFGHLTIALPSWAYWMTGILVGLAMAGAVFGLARLKPRPGREAWVHVVTVGLVPALMALSLYRSWAIDFQAQGRYLFPAMLPFVALVAYGLLSPWRGWPRSVAGFVATICFGTIMADAFVVTMLGAYRMTFGDFLSRSPVVASAWCAALLGGLALSLLAWMRLTRLETGSINAIPLEKR
jgi:hypothetical protein